MFVITLLLACSTDPTAPAAPAEGGAAPVAAEEVAVVDPVADVLVAHPILGGLLIGEVGKAMSTDLKEQLVEVDNAGKVECEKAAKAFDAAAAPAQAALKSGEISAAQIDALIASDRAMRDAVLATLVKALNVIPPDLRATMNSKLGSQGGMSGGPPGSTSDLPGPPGSTGATGSLPGPPGSTGSTSNLPGPPGSTGSTSNLPGPPGSTGGTSSLPGPGMGGMQGGGMSGGMQGGMQGGAGSSMGRATPPRIVMGALGLLTAAEARPLFVEAGSEAFAKVLAKEVERSQVYGKAFSAWMTELGAIRWEKDDAPSAFEAATVKLNVAADAAMRERLRLAPQLLAASTDRAKMVSSAGFVSWINLDWSGKPRSAGMPVPVAPKGAGMMAGGGSGTPGAGMMTPGSMTPGSMTPGSMTPGSMTPGSMTPGSMTPGSMTPGSMTPGSMTPGSMTPGSMTPGSMTPGSMTPGSMTPGSMTPGSPPPKPGG